MKLLKKLTRHAHKEILKGSILLKTISFKSATKFVLKMSLNQRWPWNKFSEKLIASGKPEKSVIRRNVIGWTSEIPFTAI